MRDYLAGIHSERPPVLHSAHDLNGLTLGTLIQSFLSETFEPRSSASAGAPRFRNIPPSIGVDEVVKIEIFSDVVCPWCAIGKRRFEVALERFAHRDEVDVVWRAFELDPGAPPLVEGDLASHLASKYAMTTEQAVASQERLAAKAAEEGLEFHFERARRANTFDAHRLLHHALEVGRQDAVEGAAVSGLLP